MTIDNIYFYLTDLFNQGKKRALLSSGQAVGLSLASKDGDWIIKDDSESLSHILKVLESFKAKYRFGAPLDKRWLSHGWSSHFEFIYNDVRVRTDFVSKPPRISEEILKSLWVDGPPPYVIKPEQLIPLKLTGREKDYPIATALSMLIKDPLQILICSRDPVQLREAIIQYPELLDKAILSRQGLATIAKTIAIEEEMILELFKEQRILMKEDRERMLRYQKATEELSKNWLDISKKLDALELKKAHEYFIEKALTCFPAVI